MSEFFFRLNVETTTTSLTRILFRSGGLGSGGEIYELVSRMSGIGLKKIPALAGHVRYRISETLEDKEALRQAYIDNVFAFEKYDDCHKRVPIPSLVMVTFLPATANNLMSDCRRAGFTWETSGRQIYPPSPGLSQYMGRI